MTPREAFVFGIVERAVSANQPCPTNGEIADAANQQSVSGPSAILKSLERRGLIKVYRGQISRVVEIVATGKRTAGEIPAPHWRDRADITPKVTRERVYHPRLSRAEKRAEPALATPRPVVAPCFMCGVHSARHEVLGCKNFVVME